MLNKNLIVIVIFILVIPLSLAYSDFAQFFNDKYPQTFEYLSKLPKDSVVLTWIDGGRALEEITELKTVAKYPSLQLLELGAIANGSNTNSTDSNEKIVNIAQFFMTEDEKYALSIARKYKAKYILITDDMIGKQYWLQHLATGCGLRNDCKSFRSINKEDKYYYQTLPGEVIRPFADYYPDYYLYIPPEMSNIMLIKMLYKPDSLEKFKLVYSDSRSKIFKVPSDLTLIYVVSGIILAIVLIFIIAKRKKLK